MDVGYVIAAAVAINGARQAAYAIEFFDDECARAVTGCFKSGGQT